MPELGTSRKATAEVKQIIFDQTILHPNGRSELGRAIPDWKDSRTKDQRNGSKLPESSKIVQRQVQQEVDVKFVGDSRKV
jgi:hypothetical protein